MNICELLQEIQPKLRPLLDDRQGKLHINCQLERGNITGDQYHLLNGFCNLVENSLKYSPAGVDIWISAFNEADGISISIKDNGPGIKKEHQSNIFSRFYRGQTNDKYKGAGFGIGLSYVKSIIESHGGKITLNTDFQEGTEFIIVLKLN